MSLSVTFIVELQWVFCNELACLPGIADYRDGTRGKDWQPHAALAAAAVMKAIVSAMDPPSD